MRQPFKLVSLVIMLQCLPHCYSMYQLGGYESEPERIRAFFAASESEIFVPDSDSDSVPDLKINKYGTC